MARRDAALNNIRSLMESQETEWLNEHGYSPVPHTPEPRMSAPKKPLSGQFAANRFIGAAPIEPQTPKAHEAPSTEPEIVEVIKQKDNRHSWLYNEVVKAIRDASDGEHTKVVAIFIPVVQNGKEFEELPVSQNIELSPVDEEALKLEDFAEEDITYPDAVNETLPPAPSLSRDGVNAEVPTAKGGFRGVMDSQSETPDEHVGDLLPEPMHEPDEELAQAFMDMEAKLDSDIAAEAQELPDIEELTEADTIDDIVDEAAETFADDVDEPEDYSEGQKLEYSEIPLPIELDDDEAVELGSLDVEDPNA